MITWDYLITFKTQQNNEAVALTRISIDYLIVTMIHAFWYRGSVDLPISVSL